VSVTAVAREAWRWRGWHSIGADSSRDCQLLPTPQNQLLALLPRADQKEFLGLCDTAELEFGQELYQAGEITTHVYFPLTGFLSLIACQPDTPKVEVGMVGSEGFIGSEAFLGTVQVPWQVVVQGAGTASRLPVATFREYLAQSEALRTLLQRYIATLMAQFSNAAPCLRFHQISQRLARWLLMTQDRAENPQFRATHEYLSYMLGVRRAGVTEAAHELQQSGAIHYERGVVTVLNRAQLEHSACSCYAADCEWYRTTMPAQ
jgi:CRP-like cAMP-binding protein